MRQTRFKKLARSAARLTTLCSCLTLLFVAGCAPQSSSRIRGIQETTAQAPKPETRMGIQTEESHHRPTRPVETTPEGTHWTASPVKYEHTSVNKPNLGLSVPVLMYHDVTYLPHNSLGMSQTQFSSEMAWLHQHGFHPIHLGQLYAAMYRKGALPSRPIVITFDDGYESVYSNAYPVLQKYNFPATVFLITGAVGHTGKFAMLTWQQLSAMETSGVIDVESHTIHHIDMSLATQAAQQRELINSAKVLTAHLHHPVLYFCYPSSKYTATTIRNLQTDGYLLAFTEHPGYANANQGAYQLHRLRVWEDMPISDFAKMLAPSLR
ncbi:polysaccharide deacetylase family protein [Alicyclobacillus ferrooxydans]|uniref:polysaccharide deacetylase family protein n=1 Tax=Alicyclobacillus ferrooxydans TaxID=471514 RepID=UPI0006D53C68|nr:polysaccharide deacetylase family protein [Alicyclobacillus ferrooxydans]